MWLAYLMGNGLARAHISDIHNMRVRHAQIVVEEYLHRAAVFRVQQQQLAGMRGLTICLPVVVVISERYSAACGAHRLSMMIQDQAQSA